MPPRLAHRPAARAWLAALCLGLSLGLSIALGQPASLGQDRPDPAAALEQQRITLAKRARRAVCAVFSLSVRLGDWSHIMGGSGFIISKDGHILTDLNVVGSLSSVSVCLPGLKLLRAKVVGRDPLNGIALLQLESLPADVPLEPLELADTAAIKVGTTAFSLGNPYSSLFNDDQIAFSAGEISGIGHLKSADTTVTRYFGTVLETTCAVNDGSYGGPLLGRDGRVLGLIARGYSTSRWLGTAVPAGQIALVLAALKQGQTPSAGVAGLTAENTVAEDQAPGAAKISALVAGGAAEKAGLRVGDIMVKLDEDRLTDGATGLTGLLGKMPAGTRVTVALKAGDKRLRFVTLVLESN